ncbi:MAG: tetratricopeptide repeat protein [Pseudomonadota bacterium]
MFKININWRCLLVITFLTITVENTLASPDSSSAVNALLDNAKKYSDIQQFERAAALLERALRIAPNNPNIWSQLAEVRLTQQNWKRAIDLAQKSNALAGSDNALLRAKNRGVITEAFELAAAELDRALLSEPNNPYLWYQLAEIRLTQAQVVVDAPIENWKRVLFLAQKSNTLAGSDKKYEELRKKNRRVITLALERALHIDPRNPYFLHDLAELRLEQKKWGDAMKLATKSLNHAEGGDYNLRLNNWVVITQACEAMGNWRCVRHARDRAQVLAQVLAQ